MLMFLHGSLIHHLLMNMLSYMVLFGRVVEHWSLVNYHHFGYISFASGVYLGGLISIYFSSKHSSYLGASRSNISSVIIFGSPIRVRIFVFSSNHDHHPQNPSSKHLSTGQSLALFSLLNLIFIWISHHLRSRRQISLQAHHLGGSYLVRVCLEGS